ncbi:MAG: TRAP transporter small permease subunit [Dehalococcoidales bacterium]|nr:TRAP transporter small permease subunit [Dehalococcoidales bacterium]
MMRKILHAIDSVNERVGAISGWLVLVLIIVILYEVIARYVFNKPTSWGFNTFRMISGALVVLGWAYAQRHNSHVRVDILYIRLSPRKQAFINAIGTGLFFFPLFGAFIGLVGARMWHTWQRYTLSLASHQVPFPANPLYQTIILIGLCLFFLQFTSRFIRDVHILIRGRPY